MLRYLSLALVCAAIALLLAKSEADTSAQYYPRFHPRPRTNWINDPNGPVYFNGVYHLFTQYNPWGSVWGNMSWAHLVSYDLVYWIEQPVAMFNDKWYDVQGVFSGSASILNDGSIALTYTCVGNDTLQRQCLAFPKDPTDRFLQEWVKFEGNPVINDAPPGASLQNVRDDTTAWTQNGKYAMTAGTVIDDQGYAWLYHSSDFKNWTAADHPLFTDQTPTGMWECPDFFPISDLDNPNSNSVFVFKVSANSQDWYRLGHFDTNAEVFVPFSNSSAYQLYDLGRMYASKRFHDPVGKRQILWGWVWEEYDEAAFMTWQGIQSLPRVLSYDWKNQRLAVAPLPGLTSLRDRESEFSESVSLSPDSNFEASAAAWNSAQFEALLEANITQCLDAETGCTFGLNLLTSSDGTETTVVSISINEPMKALQGQSISIQGGSQIAEVALDPSHSVEAQVYACQMMCTVSEQCSTWTYSPDVSAYPSRSSKKYDLGEKFPNYKVARPKSSIAFGPYCFLNSGDISLTSQIVTAGCPNCVTSLEYNGSPNPILVVDRAASGVGSNLAWVAVLPPISSDTMRVRAFVDHSVIETFVDDATSIITRVYPRNADSTSWNVFYQSNGGDNLPVKISSWKLLDAVV